MSDLIAKWVKLALNWTNRLTEPKCNENLICNKSHGFVPILSDFYQNICEKDIIELFMIIYKFKWPTGILKIMYIK